MGVIAEIELDTVELADVRGSLIAVGVPPVGSGTEVALAEGSGVADVALAESEGIVEGSAGGVPYTREIEVALAEGDGKTEGSGSDGSDPEPEGGESELALAETDGMVEGSGVGVTGGTP